MDKLATSEISIFKLVSVVEETALRLTLSETPKKGFVMSRLVFTLLIAMPLRPELFY